MLKLKSKAIDSFNKGDLRAPGMLFHITRKLM